jgi:hypothetical protein
MSALSDSVDCLRRRSDASAADDKDMRLVLAALDAAEQALLSILSEHVPQWSTDTAKRSGKHPIGCALCWPSDGSWPCTTWLEARDAMRVGR